MQNSHFAKSPVAQKRSPNISSQITSAIQKILLRFLPAWYLPNGTIKSANENDLDKASSSCELWAIICGALVVAGVGAGFIIAHIHPKYATFLRDSSYADAAVAFGIVGEVLLGMRNNRIQTELRKRSNDRLADVEVSNGFLEVRAAEANERTEKLKAQFAWREITREQELILRRELTKFSGGSLLIRFFMYDIESQNFAEEIAAIFRLAGWKTGFSFEAYSGRFAFGLRVSPAVLSPDTTEYRENERASEAVKSALTYAHLDFDSLPPPEPHMSIGSGGRIDAPCAQLYVGPKPRPLIE